MTTMQNKTSLIVIILLLLFSVQLKAVSEKTRAGIDEKLGNVIPLNTEFINAQGEKVKLSEVINKPTLLALVYYECPGICSPLQTELGWVASRVDLVPGKDFQVVSLSFDPREDYKVAARWKKNYLEGIKRGFPENAWTFLTGDTANIRKITDAVGFNYIPSSDSNFVHAGAIMAISPKGKISRYVYGLQYNPFDIKMALLDAEAGKTSPTVTTLLQYCFSYDPEGRGYTLNITRIIGTLMLLGVGSFLIVLLFKKKKENKEQE